MKVIRLIAHRLIEQLAGFIAVIVEGDDSPPIAVAAELAELRHQVACREPDRREYFIDAAASVAVNQHATIFPWAD